MSDTEFKKVSKNQRAACSCEEEEWAVGGGARSIRNWERVRAARASAASAQEAAAALADQGIDAAKFAVTDLERRLLASDAIEADRLAAHKFGALVVGQVVTAAGFGGFD